MLFLLPCLMLSIAAAAPAADGLGFDGWSVHAPGKISATDRDAIAISYESPRFEELVVRPPRPISLPPGTLYVRLWCARVAGDFDLKILIRDARGAEHAAATLTSRPEFPAIRRFQMRDWSIWRQVESICLAATDRVEDRVQPEFLNLAKRVDWPQPLALAGIAIHPAKDRRDNEAHSEADAIRAGRGTLWLAELDSTAVDGVKATSNWYLAGRWRWGWQPRPRLFLDDLTRRVGPVRYAMELRKGYQGPLVWRTEGTRTLVRTDPLAILAARIQLPDLPAGRYFLESKTWHPDGQLDRTETMELSVITGQTHPLAEARAPFTWETGQPHHVFPPQTAAARLVLRCNPAAWPGGPDPATCTIRIVDWRGRPIAESRHAKAETLTVPCTGLHEGTDYTATAEFHKGGKIFDRVALHFGVASRPRETAGPIPPQPTRDELLMSRRPAPIAELFGSAFGGELGRTASDADLQEKDRWLRSLPELGFKLGSFMFGWGECEPLPGVFRWDEIERRVALAGQLGVKTFLTPTLWGDPLEWPRWIEFQPMLDSFGHVMTPGRSGVVEPAACDPIRRRETNHWLPAVARRFLHNPHVIGYRTKPVNLPGENRPQVVRPDAAPVTRQAFADWLTAGGQSPAQLSPLFLLPGQNPARTGPDLSSGWRRFMDFRIHTYRESVHEIVRAIRAVDPQRQMHIYRSSTPTACEAAIPLLAPGAEFHDEGGPFYFQRAVESMCLQAGIPYTNEGHQFTPPSLAMVDAGFFYGSIFDRGWCWLYRWNARRHEDPRFAGLPAALRFVRDSQPALREWVGAAGDEPEVLVFGSRADRLLGLARSGIYCDIGGVESFTALFAYHQVPAHFADEYTDWVDLRRFKCVFAVGDVMTQHGIERLVEYARQGGKLVLVGTAGRFCAEQPTERDLLRKRLAGLADVRSIAAPNQEAPPPGPALHAPQALPSEDLDAILRWAGVSRRVYCETPGFECVRKHAANGGNQICVAVFRRYPGQYENIWYDDQIAKRWGRQAARVIVPGLADGSWRIEKFHRAGRALGAAHAEGGKLIFQADPATVGELQMFRLTREH